MSGTWLSDFLDFTAATGPYWTTGPSSFVVDAIQNTYGFATLCEEHPDKKMIRGGANIKFGAIYQGNGTFENSKSGQTLTAVNPQRLQTGTANWRFSRAHMAFTEQEVMLNEAAYYGTEAARFQQYVKLRDEKMAALMVEVWNGLEANLWREPVAANMESADGLDQYSLPVFINEFTNGLFANPGGAAWTTIEGLSPTAAATNSKWKCKNRTYNSAVVNNQDNIVSTFDLMWNDVEYRKPRTFSERMTDPMLKQQRIGTSSKGRAILSQLLRGSQDRFVAGPQDPAYADPQFHGIPVERYSSLDTAALYANTAGTGLATEGAAGTGNRTGPRYYWWNAAFLYPVFHEERYFFLTDPMKTPTVPDSSVVVFYIWYNIICTSLMRQGFVGPASGFATYGTY